jgi:archaellum component FlaC
MTTMADKELLRRSISSLEAQKENLPKGKLADIATAAIDDQINALKREISALEFRELSEQIAEQVERFSKDAASVLKNYEPIQANILRLKEIAENELHINLQFTDNPNLVRAQLLHSLFAEKSKK